MFKETDVASHRALSAYFINILIFRSDTMSRIWFVLTTKFLISISKLVAPPLDKVVRHGGVCGGCRSSQRFVARHALRSRTHHVHFKSAARFLFHKEY